MHGERPQLAFTSASKWNWANAISVGRLLFIPPLLYCMVNIHHGKGYLHWTLGLFLAMALSDWLDGFLARHMGWRTELGAFLDPLADKLFVVSSLVTLSAVELPEDSVRLPWWVAAAAIAKDLTISLGFVALLRRVGKASIQPRLLGRACTVLQLLTIAAVLISPMLGPELRITVPVLWSLASLIAVAAAFDYVQAGRRLAAAQARQNLTR